MRYWLASACCALLLATVVGCSSNVKSTGTVSFADDGAPVPSGKIYLVTDAFQARGEIVDGKFTISSLKEGDGLPPGDYKVYFSGVEEVVSEGKTLDDGTSTEPTYAPTIDMKYLSADTSGLTQKIDATTKTLEFKLDRNPNFPK